MNGFSKLKNYKTGVTPKWDYDTFKNMDNNIVLAKEVAQELNDTIKYLKEKLQKVKEEVNEQLNGARRINDEDYKRNGTGNDFYLGQIVVLKKIKYLIEE